METDWSVAAGTDDPIIETGWSDAASGLAWIDLHVDLGTQRTRIAALPEAAASGTLARALAMLNRPHGFLMTTKCDRWPLSDAERAQLAEVLDTPVADRGTGSYIDVLMAHAIPMADFLLHEEWARKIALRCAALPVENARMEVVIRPAHRQEIWGYGLTVYCYAAGDDGVWETAIGEIMPIVIATAEAIFDSADQVSPPPSGPHLQ